MIGKTIMVVMNVGATDYAITKELPSKGSGVGSWEKLADTLHQEVCETLVQGISMVKGDKYGDELGERLSIKSYDKQKQD